MKYSSDEPVRKPHELKVIVLVLLLVTVFGVAYWRQSINNKPPRTAETILKSAPEQKIESLQGRYLFNGTIFWGRAIEKWSQLPNGKYDYAHPFSGLKTFDRSKYDAWVADLECPVLDIIIPYQVQIDQLQFNCRPEYLKEAAKFFDVIDLANNHSGDQGLEGFEKTRQAIVDGGIQVYGNYDSTVKDDVCEVVALPIKLKPSGKNVQKAEIPVAFCAWHYFNKTPGEGEIEQMTKYANIMPVFAFAHMGTEYNIVAQPQQVEIAHKIIDAGADFVIANNPHWVQNSEAYKNKLIFYSTGNFIFDQIDSEGMRSASVDLTLDVAYDQNVQKWLDQAKECRALHDKCLQSTGRLAKPKYTLSYDIVAGDNTNKLTKKGDKALQVAIEERANWADTIRKLGQ